MDDFIYKTVENDHPCDLRTLEYNFFLKKMSRSTDPNKTKKHESIRRCVVEFGCTVTTECHGKGSWVARKGRESLYSVFALIVPQVRLN